MLGIALMLLAQGLVGITDSAGKPLDFDLKRLPAARECGAIGGDIVVCAARRKDSLQTLPDIQLPALPKAEIGIIGDVKASAELDAASVGGFPSNRAMVKLKVPF